MDCKNERPLPFDFAIFDTSGNLNLLIEYDGKQHFEPIKWFGGEKVFYYGKHNDQIKNMYCWENSLSLLRIPYWDEKNIGKILAHELLGGVDIDFQKYEGFREVC